MKRWILDPSDCAASPLLAESKRRRRWGRRSWTDTYLVPYAELRSHSNPKLSGLTEVWFSGVPAMPYKTQMELLLEGQILEEVKVERLDFDFQLTPADSGHRTEARP